MAKNLHVTSPGGLGFLTAWRLSSKSKGPKRERDRWKLFAFYEIAWSHIASLTPTQVQKDTTSWEWQDSGRTYGTGNIAVMYLKNTIDHNRSVQGISG